MADSEKEKLFQKHSQRVQQQVDAILKQKEKIRKQEEADRAFSEKVAKSGGWGGMASGQKMRLLETSLWKMQENLIDRVEKAERDLVDMDYIRKIWKIRDKAKNSTSVRNAKFKVGDRVRDTEARREGVIVKVDAKMPGYYAVKYDTRPEPQWNIPEEYLVLANSVRGNTKLKNIDYWFADNGYGDDTLIKYVQSYKKNKCIDFVDRHADTAARDAFYDAMYELTGVKNRWALNSTNAVVAKALNSRVAMNASPEASIRAEFNRLYAKGEQLKKEYKNVTNELRRIKTELKVLEIDAEKFDLRKLRDEIFRYWSTYTMS